jgi:beta-lactamase regulating signal transducer with metallopeptidase domain
MSTETITFINFLVHSLVIGAAAWLLVRFVIRDALRRCILANLAVLMCLYSPFDISMRDLFPTKQHVPVLTPIRETFEHDWRVKVEPQKVPLQPVSVPTTPPWNLNDSVKWLHRLSWLVTALLLLRLLVQSVLLQHWAWSLRGLSSDETALLRESVLECAGPPALSNVSRPAKSSRGLEHSKTLPRMRVSDEICTPCVAGWFFPVIAVPASAFQELTPPQWRWLIRHESEHLRTHDTVAVLLQNIALAFLWWNPFAHALIEEFSRAREEACDAAAVEEEPDQSSYIDFLLSWAAKPSPSRFAMSIARSRPARRLQDRLVALMEARGVRKKVGALFVLGCLAFAVLAPFVAASFGLATASAQQTRQADPKDKTMFTRIYRVVPDFLTLGQEQRDSFARQDQREPFAVKSPLVSMTAQQVLEKNGITFPEGSRALFQYATSQLIVRHTRVALDQVEAIIDRLHKRLPQVYFQCRLIRADGHFGTHEGILKPDEVKELLSQVSQQKGIDLMSAPAITTKLGQSATVEVVREVMPKVLPNGKISGEMKLLGPRIKLVANPALEGKAAFEAKVDLGVDPDAEHPWLPQKDAKPDWDRLQTFTVSSKAILASGETLILHLPTSKKPVTVLITAEALNPSGQKAISFESTATLQPSSTGIDVPDKAASEWAVRAYKLPENFAQDKPAIEMLKAAGIAFPKGADTSLKDGKLIVRNTQANLELIEAWLDAMIYREVKKSVHLSVKVVETKGDLVKLMSDWLQPSTEKVDATQTPAATEPPPLAMRQQFTVSGIFTDPQFVRAMKRFATDPDAKLEVLKPNPKPPMYVLPDAMGGQEMKVEPVIGPDGNTIELIIRTPSQDQNPASSISTAITIWDGQTVVLGSQPSEGVSRILFITGSLIEEKGKK